MAGFVNKDNHEEVILEELTATVPLKEMIKKPFFFLPKNGESNMMTETIEPYTDVVKKSIQILYSFNNNLDMSTFIHYQKNMFKDILTTNANIILDNGLLRFLEPFFTISRREVFEQFFKKKFDIYVFPSLFMLNMNVDLAASQGMKSDAEIFRCVSTTRENIASVYAKIYYEFINDIMMSGVVNINAFGDYIKNNSKIDSNTDVSESYMSLCIQCALEMANYDIHKIVEYGELMSFYVINNIIEFYTANKERFVKLSKPVITHPMCQDDE